MSSDKQFLELDDVYEYLGIDYMDDGSTNRRLKNLISLSEKFLEGSLGSDFPREDPRVKELALIVIEDLYDNHSLNEKVSNNIRRLVEDFSLQIKLEMRKK